MLRDLVSGFAHEVKNPLASMRSALRILMEKMAGEDPNRAIMEQIYEQVLNVNKTVSQLMEFTRISPPKPALTSANNLLEHVLQKIRTECQEQGIRLEEQLDTNLPQLRIDASQIELAFLNLLPDMLRAMPDGGNLVLRSSLDPEGCVLLEVEDTGPSVPEIHMERLFKPFLPTGLRGAGIGLTVVKRIITQNGGSIEADNREQGGLTFRIVFPCNVEEQSFHDERSYSHR